MSDMNDVQSLRDLSELLQQISNATGLSQDALESEVEGLEFATFKFNDSILVSPSDFEGIIDSWAEKLKAEIFSGNGSAKVASTSKKTSQAATKPAAKRGPKAKVAAKKAPAAKAKASSAAKASSSKSKPGSLPLPDDYQSIVSHLYGPSLKRIMPEGEAEQRKFLEALANETPAGVELLTHLSEIIAKKYTGKMAPSAAYNGLKNKAGVLLNGGPAPKKKGRGRAAKKEAAPKGKSKTAKKPGRPSTKAKATTKAKTALEGMELPKGYRKRVSNRYGPTLKSLLPEDPTLRAAYLKEIVAESDIGKAFLERVADSIKIKYRGRISRHTAYSGLLSKAQSM